MTTRTTGAVVCSLALLVGAAHWHWSKAAVAAQGTAKAPVPAEIPMELLFSRPLIRGAVNGTPPVAMLIDPELDTTRLTPAFAERLKVSAPRGRDSGSRAAVELVLGSQAPIRTLVDVGDTHYAVPDLSPAGHPQIVLSLSAWGAQLVTLDFVRWRVRVEPGALPDPDQRNVFSLTRGTLELRLEMTIGDRVIPGRVDAMYPGAVLLPLTYLSELRLATKPGGDEVLKTRGVVWTAREARLADDVTVAGVTLTSPLVQFGGKSDIAVVGHRFLTNHSITYDVTQHRAQFNRSP